MEITPGPVEMSTIRIATNTIIPDSTFPRLLNIRQSGQLHLWLYCDRDPQVTFLSIHRYGMGFYPGTGAADETGAGPGLGTTRNVPVRYGTPRPDYREGGLR